MFTGIVEELGEISSRQHAKDSISLGIKGTAVLADLAEGHSIAVNGVCLTVTRIIPPVFYAYVMPETLRRTNLGALKKGDKVNLERALPVGGRLGGHFVSGHIDGVGAILTEKKEGEARVIRIDAPPQVMRYVIAKGSIAVDGISLTVAAFDKNSFNVSLIPHTARFTTLGYKKPGAKVNLEADLLGKYMEKFFGAEAPDFVLPGGNSNGAGAGEDPATEGKGVTYTLLRDAGFI